MLAAPFVFTVAFFHQVPMAESKGWSLELIATGNATGVAAAGVLAWRALRNA